MKIRMLLKVSGGRGDGTEWPEPGGILVTDADEGAQLCAAGLAEPVPEEQKAEAARRTRQPAAKAPAAQHPTVPPAPAAVTPRAAAKK